MTARRSSTPVPNLWAFSWLRLPPEGGGQRGGELGLVGCGAAGSCRLISLSPSPESKRTSAGSHRATAVIYIGRKRGEHGREREMGSTPTWSAKGIIISHSALFSLYFFPLSLGEADSIRINLQGHPSKKKPIICRLLRIRISLAVTHLEDPFSVRI